MSPGLDRSGGLANFDDKVLLVNGAALSAVNGRRARELSLRARFA